MSGRATDLPGKPAGQRGMPVGSGSQALREPIRRSTLADTNEDLGLDWSPRPLICAFQSSRGRTIDPATKFLAPLPGLRDAGIGFRRTAWPWRTEWTSSWMTSPRSLVIKEWGAAARDFVAGSMNLKTSVIRFRLHDS